MNHEMPRKKEIQIDIFHLSEKLDEINHKYPNAGIIPDIVEGDQINGYTVKGQPLEEYAKFINDTYEGGSDNSEMYK